MNLQNEMDKRQQEDFWEHVKSVATMYAPHHCFNCAEDSFRCVDFFPLYRRGLYREEVDYGKIKYVYECKKCKMRQVVTVTFK